jgi:hypothetical protein
MRKLLLASAAVGGLACGLSIGPALAQVPGATAATALPPTWTEAPQVTAPSGIAAGNTNNSAQGFYTKGPLPNPTPGGVVVRFNGRVVFYGYAANQSADSVGGRKTAPYGTLGYTRLYTGIDGMTTSGLRYGAAVEIRVNTSVTTSASTNSGGASAGSNGSTLYIRRDFAYLGGTWGAIHFGSDDGPLGLLDAGVTTFQTYNDGGFNDDLNTVSPNIPVFPFPSAIGNEYTTSKIVYLSPQIAGFDFAASFEPDDNVLNDTIPGAAANSPQLSTGITASEVARRRNTYEAAVRYQGALGPAGLYAMAGYMGSGHVTRGGTIGGAPGGLPDYDNLGLIMGGLAVDFGGLRVGGSVVTGQVNNQLGLKVDGAKNMFAYIAGAQYKLGPMTVGAQYMNVLSAGAIGPGGAAGFVRGSERREGGVNIGGTYVVAPGLLGWLSATYGQRYQGGIDMNTGAPSTTANNVKFEGIAIGGAFRW